MTNRRHFFQSTAAAIASFLLPPNFFARATEPHFHFVRADTLNSWPVADPVAWSLQNAGELILQGASAGLENLTAADGDRVVRLVVRRCGLNLLELRPEKVVVHYFGQHQADLRTFFKEQGLTRPEIVVSMRDRKKEIVSTKTGDEFLFGSRITDDFPFQLFMSKWGHRFSNEADDWQAAPGTWSGFAWADTEDNRIPWAALKSAWRRAAPLICQNCNKPTILTNFGHPWIGMLNRMPRFDYVCSNCRRSFADDTLKDVGKWMTANLDPDVQPEYEMIWGKRVQAKQA